MKNKINKPKCVKESHLIYLDNLRESGITNMFGATPYIRTKFNVNKKDAITILEYWMKSFNQRHP